MKLKKLVTLSMAAALCIGTVITTNAADLDIAWYAANNPDVVAALGNSPEALRKHYETYGRKEARMANSHDMEAQIRKLFDAEEYAALYPDVKAAFGNDTEAMFQHYMAYGLLETRRPSQKVSYEAAVSMKNAVEKALEKAGLSAKPGEAPMVAILEGSAAQNAGTTEAAQAMAAVTAEVEKAVTDTVTVANTPAPSYSAPAPAPAPTTSGNGSSRPNPSTPPSSGDTDTPGSGEEVSVPGNAVWAPLADHGTGDAAVSEEDQNVLSSLNTKARTKTVSSGDATATVTFTSAANIPAHTNNATSPQKKSWIGIGVPYSGSGYSYKQGWSTDGTNFESSVEATTTADGTITKDTTTYATFYWGLTADNISKKGLLQIIKNDEVVATYVLDFSNVTIKAVEQSDSGQ